MAGRRRRKKRTGSNVWADRKSGGAYVVTIMQPHIQRWVEQWNRSPGGRKWPAGGIESLSRVGALFDARGRVLDIECNDDNRCPRGLKSTEAFKQLVGDLRCLGSERGVAPPTHCDASNPEVRRYFGLHGRRRAKAARKRRKG